MILATCIVLVGFSNAQLAKAAQAQVGVTTSYRPDYVKLRYPGGDVPISTGVCTDVIVRAFRKGGVDLQVLVHRDMTKSFGAYPRKWNLRKPDYNIDHRRVPNLQTYFRRRGFELRNKPFQPGDVVSWRLPSGRDHIGIVTTESWVVHNIGAGTLEENCLNEWPITGHYRWKW
jgi:uncharacterized protein YijF (DUF1287 family)